MFAIGKVLRIHLKNFQFHVSQFTDMDMKQHFIIRFKIVQVNEKPGNQFVELTFTEFIFKNLLLTHETNSAKFNCL